MIAIALVLVELIIAAITLVVVAIIAVIMLTIITAAATVVTMAVVDTMTDIAAMGIVDIHQDMMIDMMTNMVTDQTIGFQSTDQAHHLDLTDTLLPHHHPSMAIPLLLRIMLIRHITTTTI